MAATQYFEQVQKIFIAFYQRPADPAGLKYWAQRVDAAGGDFGAVIDAFAASPEAVELYGAIDATTIGTVIDSLYLALFNRVLTADDAGKAFYVAGFAAGTFTAGTIALAVLNGAQNDDLIAVNNKVQVANEFTQQVDGRPLTDAYFGTGASTSFNVTYQGTADEQAARDILKGVTFNTATVLNPSQVTEQLKTQIADATDPIQGQTGGQTFMLTEGADTKVGSAGNDVFNANEVTVAGGALKATLTDLDNLDGGAGTDTLNVTATQAALNTTTLGLTIKNIEIANFQGTQAMTVDSTAWTGLTNLNVTKAVDNVTLTAANTTDVKVSGGEKITTVTGGKSVTVAQAMDKAADAIVINKAGDVTVTATDSAAAAGGIKIGVGTGNAVTGAVAVTSTGAKIVGGTGTVTLDSIEVTGGTTVSVTQAATADLGDVATKGTTDNVVQGAVTVIGGAATTSVSVVQADQAVAKAAVAAIAGVSATQVVTFKAMAAGETAIIDGLTFTASKALTAAEAAAAFAGLTSTENQGQGFSSNGFYTDATSANWNTSAVSGATVTYTQKVAGTGTLATPTGTAAPTAAAGATAVTAQTAVAGVLGVANGAVSIVDNGATASIKTVVVDGYSASATLGDTGTELNALTNLTLANSGAGTATVKTNAATLGLTVNDVTAGVTLTDASLKTLNITTATKDSKFVLNTVTTVEALNVDGTNAVDLQTTTLTGLKTVTVGGSAGLTVDASGANVTSVTTTTTGTVNAKIDSSKATYTGGAGVDNVTFSNTTLAAKAVSLGAGDDTLTLATGSTTNTVPTVTIDGGAGVDTLAMAAADAAAATAAFAAKFTNFEKLSLGAVALAATNSVDLSNLNNMNYVISAGSAGGVQSGTITFAGTEAAGGDDVFTTTITDAGGTTTFTTTVPAGTAATAAGTVVSATTSNVTGTSSQTYTVSEAAGVVSIAGGTAGVPFSVSTVRTTGTLDEITAGAYTPVTTTAGTGTLALTKMANAGTLELTGAGTGATVTMLDATSLTADSFNIVTKLSTADLNYGTVAVAGVETINLTVTDTAPTVTAVGPTFGTASIQTATLTLSDAAVKSITVTGNANLALTNTDNVALTMLDASTLTGKLTATTNGTVAQTIKGGSGNDMLTAKAGATTADVLIGGAGNDTLTSNKGLNVLTGGAGVDTFVVGEASLNVNSYATITDASVGDIIKFAGTVGTFAASKVVLGGTAVFQDYANAITAGTVANALSWFQFGGDTYIVKDMNASVASFTNGTDMIVKLTGTVDLSHASYSATLGTIEIGA